MSNDPITTEILVDGETQTCLLREKVNNQNGQMLFRFLNQHSGAEYLLVKEGAHWERLNISIVPEEIFQQLCAFGDEL